MTRYFRYFFSRTDDGFRNIFRGRDEGRYYPAVILYELGLTGLMPNTNSFPIFETRARARSSPRWFTRIRRSIINSPNIVFNLATRFEVSPETFTTIYVRRFFLFLNSRVGRVRERSRERVAVIINWTSRETTLTPFISAVTKRNEPNNNGGTDSIIFNV